MTVNTLERLVETLGRGVVSVVCAPKGLDIEVHEVVVHDLVDPFEVTEGDLVLGVAVGPGIEGVDIVSDLGSKRVAGLVLKTTALTDNSIVEAAESAGLAVLSIPTGASWSQIVQLVQSVLSHGSITGQEMHGLVASDLFSLADAIAALIDAPVTIEDRGSRVLAYSGRQDEADAARAETIIGRRVPQRFLERLEAEGVFRKLRDQSGGVYVEEIGEGVLPRLAVPVRAGEEFLGSIWAAVPERPAPEVERAFADAAKVAALHLLRHRAGADVERSLQADLVASILQGTASSREAAIRLGLVGAGYRVLAGSLSAPDEADETRARTQLRDLLAVHMSTFRVRGASALLGGLVYGIIATDGDPEASEELARRIAEDLVTRPGPHGSPAIGIGGHAGDLREVPRSKREAEETLRVLRGDGTRRVATIEGVRLPALLARFSESALDETDIYAQKIAPLIESDRTGSTAYVEALRSYFDAFGDYTAA
ncbi:MAG: PucR family transcriptional regulator ligand-binding domain-containing protein, partial [Actinomycetota bacterium]|nr:PucR family transcriptional regulator ligand-binding domain-containing protein [Actinomycetota bacterium]